MYVKLAGASYVCILFVMKNKFELTFSLILSVGRDRGLMVGPSFRPYLFDLPMIQPQRYRHVWSDSLPMFDLVGVCPHTCGTAPGPTFVYFSPDINSYKQMLGRKPLIAFPRRLFCSVFVCFVVHIVPEIWFYMFNMVEKYTITMLLSKIYIYEFNIIIH